MSIRKWGRGWQVRVEPFPAVTLPTREAAKTMELDLRLKKTMGALYREAPRTLGEEIASYLERKGARRPLRPASVEFFAKGARQWDSFRGIPLASLRRAALEDHITRRARTRPVAARNELQLLKAVLREAVSRGQSVDPGIFQIPAVRVEHAEGQVLELADVFEIQSWMPEHVARIVPFVASVGLRFSEALSLDDGMVDLDGASILIPRDLNKSRRPKPIPLGRREVQLLREQIMVRPAGSPLLFPNEAGGRYSETAFRRRWTEAVEKSGRKGYKFHWLRHTAISSSARAGIPVEMIALRVGHNDGGALILSRYRHLFANEAKTAVALLDAYLDGQEADIRKSEGLEMASMQAGTR